MAFEKKPLEKIIRDSVSFKITELEIDDAETETPLEYLEDLRANMSVRIRVAPDLGRDMSFIMRLRVGDDRVTSQVGIPVGAFRKVRELEDVSKYTPEIVRCAQQIVEAINKATREQN